MLDIYANGKNRIKAYIVAFQNDIDGLKFALGRISGEQLDIFAFGREKISELKKALFSPVIEEVS